MRPTLSLLLLASVLLPNLHAAGLEQLITEYNSDRRDIASALSVPWSPASMAREDALIAAWENRLDTLPYDSLDPAARIDWHLLHTQLRERHTDLDLARRQLQEIAPLIAFAAPLQDLLTARTQRQLADPEKSAAALAQALADLKSLRKKLDAAKPKDPAPPSATPAPGSTSGPSNTSPTTPTAETTPPPADSPPVFTRPTPVIALRAAGAIDELRSALSSWYAFYDGFQPDFTWWTAKPHESLDKELTALATYLRRDLAAQKDEPDDPLVGDPIGAQALTDGLAAEMIAYTPQELIAIAEKQFTWCETEMTKAAHDLGCASGPAAVAFIKDHHAPPGAQAAAALTEAGKAIAFVKDHDLVTIPPLAEEVWGIGMLGPDQQKSLPYAVYGQPRIMVAYAAASMTHEDKLMSMRGNNAAFLHIVTPHELIPGHHLQGFMARRNAAYRQTFSTPFLVEGWALHWEMLLYDQGYVATPEEKVGALFWRMHRCARIITTLKFHLGEMTPAQMVDFLADRVGHERAGATSEVRRYIGGAYGPLYQVAYMTGGLQLGALQTELCGDPPHQANDPAPDSKGIQRFPHLTLRNFHDQILLQGPIPIEMIRAALLHTSLSKDWKPAWKFAG